MSKRKLGELYFFRQAICVVNVFRESGTQNGRNIQVKDLFHKLPRFNMVMVTYGNSLQQVVSIAIFCTDLPQVFSLSPLVLSCIVLHFE